MRRIFLIDSPGIVYDNGDDEVCFECLFAVAKY
jgi:ribosome biogenesis GTPase A